MKRTQPKGIIGEVSVPIGEYDAQADRLQALEQELESARTVYANIEAWLLEHAIKVETHDWAHFKSVLAHGFRVYSKYLAQLAAGTPPFIKTIDERNRLRGRVKELEEENQRLRDALETERIISSSRLTTNDIDARVVESLLDRVKEAEAELATLRANDERWRELANEMRTIATVAGQCSVEGPQSTASLMAAAEAERCAKWADTIYQLLRTTPHARAGSAMTSENERLLFERWSRLLTDGNAATWDELEHAVEQLACSRNEPRSQSREHAVSDERWLEHVRRLETALRGILNEPYGCSLCDSGKARSDTKGHQPSCPFEIARDLLRTTPPTREPEQP